MDSVKLMMGEHQNILRMLEVVRNACYGIYKGEDICYEDFAKMIDFIRNYADNHHHGKEEKLLFNRMVEHLGPVGTKLITHGMMVEHDFGRLYIRELEEALEEVKKGDDTRIIDVIANAVGYTNLLKRHIQKEDTVVYSFATRQLSKEIIDQVNQETADFEAEADKNGTRTHYLDILEELEKKYSK